MKAGWERPVNRKDFDAQEHSPIGAMRLTFRASRKHLLRGVTVNCATTLKQDIDSAEFVFFNFREQDHVLIESTKTTNWRIASFSNGDRNAKFGPANNGALRIVR